MDLSPGEPPFFPVIGISCLSKKRGISQVDYNQLGI